MQLEKVIDQLNRLVCWYGFQRRAQVVLVVGVEKEDIDLFFSHECCDGEFWVEKAIDIEQLAGSFDSEINKAGR